MCKPLLALDVQIPATRKITHYYCQLQTQKIKVMYAISDRSFSSIGIESFTYQQR